MEDIIVFLKITDGYKLGESNGYLCHEKLLFYNCKYFIFCLLAQKPTTTVNTTTAQKISAKTASITMAEKQTLYANCVRCHKIN